MDRRAILKYTALITGAAISAPLASSLIVACQADYPYSDNAEERELHFFGTDDFKMISKIIDIILPETDSPSATQVGVHKMIDQMLGLVYTKREQEDYQQQLNGLKSYLKERNFGVLSSNDSLEVLSSLEKANDNEANKQAFLNLKQQTIAYYLSTEEIGTKFLNYLPIPGDYEACISVESVGNKVWAE